MNILEKNLLILASAGSGKTYQLGNRVIGLVARGIDPERIVALTFTRKAAGEFADSVLNKLAAAAADPAEAAKLRRDIGLPEADFSEVLARVVKALPRITLGTLDGFFARVVRGFQYELGLTGGKFELLEGPRSEAARDVIISEILGGALDQDGGEEFFHAFRRANLGREDPQVQKSLREFLKTWHARYRAGLTLEWGPPVLSDAAVEDWEKEKLGIIRQAESAMGSLEFTQKTQCDALQKVIDVFRQHTIGSGAIGACTSGLLKTLFEAAAGEVPLRVKHYKEFVIGGPCGEAVHRMIRFAARCEMAAALQRTRAVREVVAAYDRLCAARLRRNGLLGFDDIKELMGEWVKNEDARLRREAVDFRLDARFDHWLLDEFQDTSRADWMGLLPLLDEAAGEGEGTMFIVGDRKQAIYGWRGGEVGLFDEVRERYDGAGLQIKPMADSWRSCPEVLELVNRVCGDLRTLEELFGKEAADRWQWQDHVAAEHLRLPHRCGEARVERLEETWEGRLVPLLREIGVGERKLSCGVLVRSNDDVKDIADHLRAEGFDVVEEGSRRPGKDGPVGITLAHLLRWLAEPSDDFAREVVAMSPLAGVLKSRHGESWFGIWDGLLRIAAAEGFSAMISSVVEGSRGGWSDFGRLRAAEIVSALARLDSTGAATARQASDWIERLEVSQSPGSAAVQVMTIHKSKGLGFDVVVLPKVPTDSIPQTQYFEVAECESWLTGVPPSWARAFVPEIASIEEKWRAQQRYEAFCMLYVALTRAKRGLYVLLDKLPKTPDFSKPTLPNWIATAIDGEAKNGVLFQAGSAAWSSNVPLATKVPPPSNFRPLPLPQPRRERSAPSRLKQGEPHRRSAAGMKYGRDLHQAFESVGWIDEEAPPAEAHAFLRDLLDVPEIAAIFQRRGREVELLREQPVEAILDGRWLSGTIDRLHLHRQDGAVRLIEVIDFKTDSVERIDELTVRYAAQMGAYRQAMQAAFPKAEVKCALISTRCSGVQWL